VNREAVEAFDRRWVLALVALLVLSMSSPVTAAPSPGKLSPAVSPLATTAAEDPGTTLHLDDSASVRVPAISVFDSATAGPVQPGEARTVVVAGVGGVPRTGAGSVVLTIDVADATGAGQVTVSPAGETGSRLASVRFGRNQRTSREVTVKLGAGGAVRLVSSRTVAARLQVVGWYPESDAMFPVRPAMVAGTRTAGLLVRPGSPRTVRLTGRHGVPSGLTSAVLVNVITDRGRRAGTLAMRPVGLRMTMSLAQPRGAGRAEQLLIPVGDSGRIRLSSTERSRARLEVVGWTPIGVRHPVTSSAPVSTGQDGVLVRPGKPATISVAGRRGVPAGGAALVGLTMWVSHARRAGSAILSTGPGSTETGPAVRFDGGRSSSQAVTAQLSSTGQITVSTSTRARVRVVVDSWQPQGNGHFNTLVVPESTTVFGPGDVVGDVPFVLPEQTEYALTLDGTADPVSVGDVVAVGATASNPSGIVAEVLSRVVVGGEQQLRVAVVPLEEAFTQVDIRWSGRGEPLLRDSTASGPAYARARAARNLNSLKFGCGKLEVAARLDADVHLRFDVFVLRLGFGDPEFEMKTNFGGRFTAKLAGGIDAKCEKIGPIIVGWTVPSTIGPIALTARPGYRLDGSVDVMSLGLEGSVEVQAGISFRNGTWDLADSTFDSDFRPPTVGDITRPRAQLVVSAGTKLTASVWGRVGISLFAGPELSISTEARDEDYYCKTELGAVARLSVDADFIVAQASVDFATLASATVEFDSGICGTIAPPRITSTGLVPGLVGVPYAHRLTVGDGAAPYTWSATGLPPGTLVQGDTISGTPTQRGTFSPSITVRDLFGRTSHASLTLKVTSPDDGTAAVIGTIARLPDGQSWYVDKRGGRHAIADGGIYECLSAQGVAVTDTTRGALSPLPVHEPAQCVRAEPGDIIRHRDGDAYLINSDWTRSWIPDGTTFECLRLNGTEVVDTVPRYYVMDLDQAGDKRWNCLDGQAARGHLVRAGDGSSWYVDLRGDRHWVPDGGTYECLAAQGRTPTSTVVPRWLINSLGAEQEAARCVRAEPGDIIRTPDGDSYLIRSDWTRGWIPDGGSFLCYRANGHPLVDDVPRYFVEDVPQGPHASYSCYDSGAVRGRVVRGSDGKSWYVDKRGGKHWIPDGGTYDCIAAQTGLWQHTVPSGWLTQPQYENAQCVRANPGDIIRHSDGDAYLLNGDWSRGWIPTASSYTCFRAEGRKVVDGVPRYYIGDLAEAGHAVYPSGNCLIRRDNGNAYFVNNEGRKEWVPDTPTWDCERGRAVPVVAVTDAFADSVTEVGWHYCLNKAQLHGKVLRHSDGDAHYVHPDDTRTWIPDEFTFGCRTRQGAPVVETRWREYVNAFTDHGWDYCFDVETFKGRLIRHPDGDVHYVGGDGRRHWVPGDRYACMVNRFGPPATVRWRQYVDNLSAGEWAVCGDTLYRSQLLDRGQWLSSSDGRYKLHMQTDGNLVLYNAAGTAIWATNLAGRHLKLHNDGCLAEVDYSGNWVWRAGCGQGGDRLVLQSDGNLVLYAGGRAVWASNTVGR